MGVLLLLVVIAVLAVAALAYTQARDRKRKELRAEAELRAVSRTAGEDVTRFGEELQELHIDTLTTELDVPMRQDYQRALDCYENAKEVLHEAQKPEDIGAVTKVLEDGRYAQACVLARQAGEPLPQRRPPCFFNPAHGPAQTDIEWAPPGGIPREIPVCLADADRVEAGAEPDTRHVRKDGRMVPWYQGGPAYGSYADGYYGAYAMNGLFPAFLLGSMMGGFWGPDVVETGGESGGELEGAEDWSSEDMGAGQGAEAGGDYGVGDDYGGGGGDYGGGGGDFGGFGGGDFGGGF